MFVYWPAEVLKNNNWPPVNPAVLTFFKLPSVTIHPWFPANIVSATNPKVFAEPCSAVAEANLTAILPPCDPEMYTTWPFVNVVPWAL